MRDDDLDQPSRTLVRNRKARVGDNVDREGKPLNKAPRRKPLAETHETSFRRTLVFMWLDSLKIINHTEVGGVLLNMRARRDMPRSFPNKKYLVLYMQKCGTGSDVIERVFERIWSMYKDWEQRTLRSSAIVGADPVKVHTGKRPVVPGKEYENPWDDPRYDGK